MSENTSVKNPAAKIGPHGQGTPHRAPIVKPSQKKPVKKPVKSE